MLKRLTRIAVGTAVIVGAVGGGAAIGNAASSKTTVVATSTTAPSANFPAHGSAAHEDAEKVVSGDAATKAQAAALKAVGSGTAGAVTSDFSGDGYEVTVTKSDGSAVEVHLDSSYTVQDHGHAFGG